MCCFFVNYVSGQHACSCNRVVLDKLSLFYAVKRGVQIVVEQPASSVFWCWLYIGLISGINVLNYKVHKSFDFMG